MLTYPPRALVVLSGGLDSTTALYLALSDFDKVSAITFDYGQRHAGREVLAARSIAGGAQVPHDVINLSNLATLFSTSALTNPDIPVPLAPYDAPTMDATVVPMRNAIMLSIAAAVLARDGGGVLVAGMHAADHALYPDCRPPFKRAMQEVISNSLDGISVVLHTPFIKVDKSEIVRKALAIGAPLDLTYSCYQGGLVHCGVCGTCRERKRAFVDAGVGDPTTYAE